MTWLGMQNDASMFYLFKFDYSYSHNHHNNSGVCFGPFNHHFVLHLTYKMLLAFKVV